LNLDQLYNTDASESWFTKPYQKLSVHESLTQRGFKIVDRASLQNNYGDIEIPATMTEVSWGSLIPRPKVGKISTFVAGQMYDLQEKKYGSQSLSKIVTTWMQEYLNGRIFLISLNPAHYLVTTTNDVSFKDVFSVSRVWSIDSWIGVFDESGSFSFIFDTEFWATIISCEPMQASSELHIFFDFYNNEFDEIFIRDNHLLSGADAPRAQEYYEKYLKLLCKQV